MYIADFNYYISDTGDSNPCPQKENVKWHDYYILLSTASFQAEAQACASQNRWIEESKLTEMGAQAQSTLNL